MTETATPLTINVKVSAPYVQIVLANRGLRPARGLRRQYTADVAGVRIVIPNKAQFMQRARAVAYRAGHRKVTFAWTATA